MWIVLCMDKPKFNWLKSFFKRNLKDWYTVVNCFPKCINYRIFKTNFCLENYLLSLPRDLKIVFAKIGPEIIEN